jgi:branched-chain amino acid transport system substrate-binding protein
MNRRRKRISQGVAAGVLLALVVVVATGFAPRSGNSTGLKSGSITVGFGNNLTGFLAAHDKLISNGANLAVAQINAKGGIGGKVKIKLTLRDVQSRPDTSVQVARDFLAKKVNVLMLPCNTDFQVAMTAVANPKGQFIISPCNGDPTVAAKFSHYWPVGMAGNAQMAQLANYAKKRGYKKVYVLDAPQMLYVHLMAKYFKKAAPSRGISVVATDDIPFGATGFPQDYATQATKIKNNTRGAQAIMTGLFSPFVDFLARDLRRAGVNLPVIGSDGMDTQLNLTTGAASVNGYAFTTFGYPDKGSPTARFYAQFKGKFGGSPDGSYPALGYDSIKVLEAAVLKAGSSDPKKIEAVLKKGITVHGALGPIRFSGKSHNPTNLVAALQIRNGKFVKVLKSVPKNVPSP